MIGPLLYNNNQYEPACGILSLLDISFSCRFYSTDFSSEVRFRLLYGKFDFMPKMRNVEPSFNAGYIKLQIVFPEWFPSDQ